VLFNGWQERRQKVIFLGGGWGLFQLYWISRKHRTKMFYNKTNIWDIWAPFAPPAHALLVNDYIVFKRIKLMFRQHRVNIFEKWVYPIFTPTLYSSLKPDLAPSILPHLSRRFRDGNKFVRSKRKGHLVTNLYVSLSVSWSFVYALKGNIGQLNNVFDAFTSVIFNCNKWINWSLKG